MLLELKKKLKDRDTEITLLKEMISSLKTMLRIKDHELKKEKQRPFAYGESRGDSVILPDNLSNISQENILSQKKNQPLLSARNLNQNKYHQLNQKMMEKKSKTFADIIYISVYQLYYAFPHKKVVQT